MEEHNRAIKMAQKVIRKSAETLPTVIGMHGPDLHPDKSGMLRSARLLDGLILDEEDPQ